MRQRNEAGSPSSPPGFLTAFFASSKIEMTLATALHTHPGAGGLVGSHLLPGTIPTVPARGSYVTERLYATIQLAE